MGLVLQSSNEAAVEIGWLSGKKQIVPRSGGTWKEVKERMRIERYKVLDISQFTLQVGIPAMMLKIENREDVINVRLDAIKTQGVELDKPLLVRKLQELVPAVVKKQERTEVDVSVKDHGDLLHILVQFWR